MWGGIGKEIHQQVRSVADQVFHPASVASINLVEAYIQVR